MYSPGSECALFSCETIPAIVTKPVSAYRPPMYESDRARRRGVLSFCAVGVGKQRFDNVGHTHTGAERVDLD
jgi:hypothetical protein